LPQRDVSVHKLLIELAEAENIRVPIEIIPGVTAAIAEWIEEARSLGRAVPPPPTRMAAATPSSTASPDDEAIESSAPQPEP